MGSHLLRWCIPAFLIGLCLVPAPGRCMQTATAAPATREVRLTGYTRARHVMDVVSQVSGVCRSVAGDVGRELGQKGVFAELDRTFIDLDLDKNRAEQQRLRVQIEYYRTTVRRYERLVSRDLADQDSLDRERNRLEVALQDLELAKVTERELKERRSRHTVKAAPGWTITQRLVEPGQWVRSGQVIGRVGDYRSLVVPFSLAPEELAALRNQRSDLKLFLPHQGRAGQPLPAAIETISPAFDPETRKVRVELLLEGESVEPRGGQLTELVLSIPEPGPAVVLPGQALRSSYEEHWLVRENGRRVPVILMERLDNGRIVVRSDEVRPGQRFQLRPSD